MWPDFLRVAKEVNPIAVVNENVGGQISNGVLERKIADLRSIGYEVWPALVIPACFTGHYILRERVFIVAISNTRRLEGGHNRKAKGQWKDPRRPVSELVEDHNGKLCPKPIFHKSNYGIPEQLDGISVSK